MLSACSTLTPMPSEIKAEVAAKPIEDLPTYISIEQLRCPKSRYFQVDKRMECRHKIRREIAERQLMEDRVDKQIKTTN
jgi:hypothetical protein